MRRAQTLWCNIRKQDEAGGQGIGKTRATTAMPSSCVDGGGIGGCSGSGSGVGEEVVAGAMASQVVNLLVVVKVSTEAAAEQTARTKVWARHAPKGTGAVAATTSMPNEAQGAAKGTHLNNTVSAERRRRSRAHTQNMHCTAADNVARKHNAPAIASVEVIGVEIVKTTAPTKLHTAATPSLSC